MKNISQVLIYLFCFLILFILECGILSAYDQEQVKRPPGPDEVLIAPNCIVMALGKIILIRKDSDYCAVKFIEFRTGKTKDDNFARYESYYQGDKTGSFLNANVKLLTKELIEKKASWSLFGHPVAFGENKEIECGPIKLWWVGKGSVYFYKRYQTEGDYGVELAPTPWSTISEVNIFDSRMKWYRYDEKRKRVIIPIDQLWKEKEEKK